MTINDGQRAPGAWSDLSDAEWSVLWDALYESNLVMVVNGWASPADAPYWNRKEKYVAEVSAAALSLLHAGLIEVWEKPEDGIGDAELLMPETAEQVLATPSNWWRYDPDGNWDPDEDLSRYATYEQAEPVAHTEWRDYWVMATERGRTLERDGGERRNRPDDRSPEERRRAEKGQRLARRWTVICYAAAAGKRTGLVCPVHQDGNLIVEPGPTTGDVHGGSIGDSFCFIDQPSTRHRLHLPFGRYRLRCPSCGAEHYMQVAPNPS